MKLLTLAFLLSVSGSRLVLDDTIEIPRAEWRYVDVEAKEAKAVINCEYQVVSENSPVRAVWIRRENLEEFRAGSHVNILAASPFGMEGRLRHVAPESGDYALVLESQAAARLRAKVKARVWLESAVQPRELAPGRRLSVILISAAVFFAMVSFSAFRIRASIR
ncbi:MAG TPA: hypothetical protein VL285_25370 [Bryobacteraceae bacterium]|nr:hypothetical protein [Bryobacteraceae bacterium]